MQVDPTQQQQHHDMEVKQHTKEMQLASITSVVDELRAKMGDIMSAIDESVLSQLIMASIINKPRDKQLKDTQSFSTNTFIKIYYLLKELNNDSFAEGYKNVKEFVNYLRENKDLLVNNPNSQIKLEDSGYLTFINMEKDIHTAE